MCLAIPMKVTKKTGVFAVAQVRGVSRTISLELIRDVKKGDYVLVHAGFAIEKVDPKKAKRTLDLLKRIRAEGNDMIGGI